MPDGSKKAISTRNVCTHEKPCTRINIAWRGSEHMSQEQADEDALEEHRERIRRVIDEDRDILDELA